MGVVEALDYKLYGVWLSLLSVTPRTMADAQCLLNTDAAVNFWLPDSVLNAADALGKDMELTRSDVIRNILFLHRYCVERLCMNDLTNPDLLATPHLATPDNSHNCEAPNEGETQATTPPEPPKLPLAFTVITGIQPTRLTKIIGLNATGGMRKETSAMLSRGQAQRVAVADLLGLKSHLETLTSAQAVTWGVTKDEAVAVCIG